MTVSVFINDAVLLNVWLTILIQGISCGLAITQLRAAYTMEEPRIIIGWLVER